MSRTIVLGIAAFAVIQVIRPARTNPPIDRTQTLQTDLGAAHPAVPAIGRACQDCHSYQTSWPWYSQVAPVSWLVAHDVAEGRRAVNFSTWNTYSSHQKNKLAKEICDEVGDGRMPMKTYAFLHPDAKLDRDEVRTLCGLAQSMPVEEAATTGIDVPSPEY